MVSAGSTAQAVNSHWHQATNSGQLRSMNRFLDSKEPTSSISQSHQGSQEPRPIVTRSDLVLTRHWLSSRHRCHGKLEPWNIPWFSQARVKTHGIKADRVPKPEDTCKSPESWTSFIVETKESDEAGDLG
jgi:hypothetical protein